VTGHPQPATTPAQRLLETVLGVFGVGLMVTLSALLPPETRTHGPGQSMFALGFLLVAGLVGGQVAGVFRLPRLTGYLLAGVLFGPHGLGVLGHHEVKTLELINALALALIALQAGAEFTMEMLRAGWRSLAWASLTQLVVLIPGMAVGVWLARDALPFLDGAPWQAALGLALTWAAISVSKSPAATLAVVGETRAKGPLTSYAMGMVVVFDVVVLVVFSVALTGARVLMEPGATFSLKDVSALGEELVASVAAGTTLGLLVAAWLWLVNKERLLFVVVLAYGVTAFCRYFHYDTLLVFVIAGFIVQNLSRQGPALTHTVEEMSGAVMVVFFATAGAHLDIEVLRTGWKMALFMAGLRVALTYIACKAGHRLAKDDANVTRLGWTSLVSQAGVTIGLVTLAAEKLPNGLGTGLAAMGIAVVGINEIVGPVLFKASLSKAGEAGKAAPGTGPSAAH